MCGAFIFLLPLGTRPGWLTPWMVTVVVARELIITGLRSFLEIAGRARSGPTGWARSRWVCSAPPLIAIFVALWQ